MRRTVALLSLLVAACDERAEDAREAQITAVLASFDEPLIRTRPALTDGKYTRMAAHSFDYFRGTLPVYRSDMRTGTSFAAVTRFSLDVPLVPSLGDPHPENFGILRAGDGTFGLEPNDFDAADRAPYLWDVRRLTSGMALGAGLRGITGDARRGVARAAALGYRAAIEAIAAGGSVPRIDTAGTSPILDDLFRRSNRDHAARRELAERTTLENGVRRLKRGNVDPEDAQNVYADLPPHLLPSLTVAVEKWRSTLVAPPPPEHVAILDAVREFGSGVASWPRVRVILLARGPTDDPADDLMLELKELVDSSIAGLYPPGIYHDGVGERVLTTSRAAWSRPDAEPLWGVTDWLGLRCQIRNESEGQKNVRVDRWEDEQGTPEVIGALGRVLGTLIARMHASGPGGVENARAIYGRIAIDPEGFADEQADVAVRYADEVIGDYARFLHALRRHGLRLGIPFDPADAPRPDLAAIFGLPPPPQPLPPVTP